MAEIEDSGGPAFPFHTDLSALNVADYAGMTLRDYFAAAALTGIITRRQYDLDRTACARIAYECADAMLKARQA